MTYLGQRASGAWVGGGGSRGLGARSLGRKAHCAFGAACSSSAKPLLALAASFCWIRPLRFSAAKTRWDREHLRHGIPGEVGQGDPHRGGGGSPPCCRRRTVGSRAQLPRVPDAPAQALSERQNRQCEHSGEQCCARTLASARRVFLAFSPARRFARSSSRFLIFLSRWRWTAPASRAAVASPAVSISTRTENQTCSSLCR